MAQAIQFPSISPAGAFSVWRRHFHVYRKTALLSFLPPMTEPLFYLLAFGYGMTPLVGDVSYLGVQVDYVRFLSGGMIAVGVLFQSFFEGAYNSFVRITFQKTWHALLTTPLTYGDIFVGELLWAATKGIIAGTLTATLAIIWGALSIKEFLTLIPAIILGSLTFAALGLWSSGWAKRIEYLNIPVFLLLIPMFSFCGTYFPRTTLPPALHLFSLVLPLSPLIDLLRSPIHLPEKELLTILTLSLWCFLFTVGAWNSIWKRVFR